LGAGEGVLQPASGRYVCAVCIPPGASLELQGISERLQHDLGVGPIERVTFTQITANPNSYRDAVLFANRRDCGFRNCKRERG
jgi:hypothetical protein